jgi:hypothetical protein
MKIQYMGFDDVYSSRRRAENILNEKKSAAVELAAFQHLSRGSCVFRENRP